MGVLALVSATVASTAAVAVLGVNSDSAYGAFPGAQNGQLTFVSSRDRTGNSQIFVMGPSGANPTNISNTDDNDSSPSFSADGQKIVFDGDPDIGNDELYLMDANGENRKRLTSSEKDESDPVFSPDGSQIAFTSFVNGSYPEVHVMNTDGSNERRLTVAPAQTSDSSPAWSPDGSKIAFDRNDNSGETVIYVVNADGSNATPLTAWDGKSDFSPDFSPDGSKIAFSSDRDGNVEIYSMDAGGGNQNRLTNSAVDDVNPAWSPDGSTIAFEQRPVSSDPHTIILGGGEIFVMSSSGQNLHSITNDRNPDSDGSEPSWQPLDPSAITTPPVLSGGPIEIAPLLVITGRSTPPRAVAASRRTGRGTTIRYRISKTASVKLAVERLSRGIKRRRKGKTRCVSTKSRKVPKRKRCTATKLSGWLVRQSRRGKRKVPFSGRIGKKALPSGLYRLRAGAVDSNANTARHKYSNRFRVTRR